mgnify:CR=1 FL=1
MNTFGQEVKTEPDWPDENTQKLRLELIAEEIIIGHFILQF